MNRRTVLVDSRSLLVAVDDAPPVAERWWALATGRAIDEQTGAPVRGSMRGRAERSGVSFTTSGDGSFCVVARPWLACPPLAAPAFAISMSLDVEGYLREELTIDVSSQHRLIVAPAPAVGNPVLALANVAGLVPGQLLVIGPTIVEERGRISNLGPGPQQVTMEGGLGRPHNIGDPVVADAWTPVDLGTIHLRRTPVVIRGRTVRRDAATNIVTAVPNATIALSDFWFTLADVRAQLPGAMTDPNPATRAFIVSIVPGLVTSRDVGPGQVARQDLTPAVGDDRLLVAAVADGDGRCRVSDRQGLAAGTVLSVDPDQPDIVESIAVTTVTGFGPPDQPGDLTLELPFRRSHRAGTRLVPVTPQPSGPSTLLRRDARPGDVVLFVASLGTLPDDVDVQVTGGALPIERQRLARVEATSDADGYFALPPVHRVAALQLRATAPPLTPIDLPFHPDYATPENWIDVVFA